MAPAHWLGARMEELGVRGKISRGAKPDLHLAALGGGRIVALRVGIF